MLGLLFKVVGLGFRGLSWALATPTRARSAPPQRDRQPATKKKALSAAEMKPLIDSLPNAKVLFVLDGDTLIVDTDSGETVVRLDSIDCPEDGQEWGDTAAYGLIKLVGGQRVQVEEHGIDPYGRTLATLYVRHPSGEGWQNVNERMVTLGHAWVMREFYDHLPKDRRYKLNHLEAWARSRKVGLWKTDNPIAPWLWRKQVSWEADAYRNT